MPADTPGHDCLLFDSVTVRKGCRPYQKNQDL